LTHTCRRQKSQSGGSHPRETPLTDARPRLSAKPEGSVITKLRALRSLFPTGRKKFWDSNFFSSFRCNLSRDTSSLYRKNTYRPVDNVLFYRPIFSDWTGTLPHPTVRRNPGAALGGPVSGNLDLENFRLFFPGAPIGPSPGFSVTTHRPRDSSRFSGIGTYDSDAPPESAQLPPQSSSIHRRDLEKFSTFFITGTYDSDAPPESAQLPPQSSSIHRRDLENFQLFSSPGLTTHLSGRVCPSPA
jgi:hypothetical protein